MGKFREREEEEDRIMASRRRLGFTLVELLVVVVIISMLAGLLLPAVLAARGKARLATCMNNQKQIGLAIIQYEGAKKRMPGYINRLGQHAVGWVPVLLPFIGRTDLWEDSTTGWRKFIQSTAAAPAPTPAGAVDEGVRLPLLICPEADATPNCALTYVVNTGIALDTFVEPGANTDPAVFRNLVPVDVGASTTVPKPISLTSIKSSSQRPMLSERQYPVQVATETPDADRVWNSYSTPPLAATATGFAAPPAQKLMPSQLGFRWIERATADTTAITVPFVNPTLESQRTTIHRGVVIVTFCDGHTDAIADNAMCSDYDSKPIP